MDWTQHLDALVNWAYHKGYHVEFTVNGDDCICGESKLIEINSSSSLETQVIRLLHECGHVLIFENGSFFNFKEKNDLSDRSVTKKVFTVIEEIEAWKRGKELASRMQIPMAQDIWERAMVKALKKYIDWASTKIKEDINED